MGCILSRKQQQQHSIGYVDDSVRVMISHEKKIASKKGVPVSTTSSYIPRAEHPLLVRKENDNMDAAATATGASTTATTTETPSSTTTTTAAAGVSDNPTASNTTTITSE
jgi:hypothetical protein